MQDAFDNSQPVRVGQDGHYAVHMFVCTNRRNNARSCGGSGSEQVLNSAKRYLRSLQDNLGVNIRISSSGCMGRCEHGPVLVIYPEGVWYRCHSGAEVEEIVARHLREHIDAKIRSEASMNLVG